MTLVQRYANLCNADDNNQIIVILIVGALVILILRLILILIGMATIRIMRPIIGFRVFWVRV